MKQPTFDPTKTVLTITVGFLIIYLVTGWQWTIAVSVVAGLAGVFSEKLSGYINILWTRLTIILSYIIPNLVLALIYYLVLVPVALLARFFKKEDELMIREKPASTFVDVNRTVTPESMEKLW